jgi:hypothetical protein
MIFLETSLTLIPILILKVQTTLVLCRSLVLPGRYFSKEILRESESSLLSFQKILFVAPWKVSWVTALEKKIKIPIWESSPLLFQSSLCQKSKTTSWVPKDNTEAIPTDFNPWKSSSTGRSSARSTAMKEERIRRRIMLLRRIWGRALLCSKDQVNSSYNLDKETNSKKIRVTFYSLSKARMKARCQ